MKKENQLKFWKSPATSHGGAQAIGRRKSARAIVTQSPMHVTFKSSRARGEWTFHRWAKPIEAKIRSVAKKFRVRIYLIQNVGNHLHLAVQAASRRELQNFLRVVPQAVAFLVTGAKKGNPIGKFWDALVHTRVVRWGKDWFGLQQYLDKNKFEAAGAPRALLDAWLQEARNAWSSA